MHGSLENAMIKHVLAPGLIPWDGILVMRMVSCGIVGIVGVVCYWCIYVFDSSVNVCDSVQCCWCVVNAVLLWRVSINGQAGVSPPSHAATTLGKATHIKNDVLLHKVLILKIAHPHRRYHSQWIQCHKYSWIPQPHRNRWHFHDNCVSFHYTHSCL